MVRHGEIEKLGIEIQKRVIKLSIEGMTAESIADQINSEFNTNITTNQVLLFLRRTQNKQAKLLKEDKEANNKIINTYFDTISQIRELNSSMWRIFYELDTKPEITQKTIKCQKCGNPIVIEYKNYQNLLKIADTLLNQIKHVDTILGKLQKKSLNITYNYVDLSKKIGVVMPNILNQLERRGIIKINKKKMKSYYGGIQKMVGYNYQDEEDEEDEENYELDGLINDEEE